MDLNFLDFEQPIAELEAKIEELRLRAGRRRDQHRGGDRAPASQEPDAHRAIFANLDAWQISQLARHPQRPYTLDYIRRLFTDSTSCTATAPSPTTRPSSAAWRGSTAAPVMVIGHQKGRDTKEKMRRNFGMPQPGGLSQGAAADAAGRAVPPADPHLHRHPGRLSGRRRRGARPERGHRPQPA